MPTHYETLGLSERASAEEIKASYRRLIRQHHPDIAGPEGARRTGEINHAYQVLSSEDSRILYDADLRRERAIPEPEENVDAEPSEYIYRDYPEYEPVRHDSQEFVEESPVSFADYWDHPVTRRRLITGMVGYALLLTAFVIAAMHGAGIAIVSVLIALIFPFPRVRSWAVLAVSLTLGVVYAYQSASPWASVMVAAIAAGSFPARVGLQTLIGVVAGIVNDRSRIAQNRRERRLWEKQRRYQQFADERRRERMRKSQDRRE